MKPAKKTADSSASDDDMSEISNDYNISDEDEMDYDSASNECSEESELEEDLDSADESDEMPVETNVSDSKEQIKKLIKLENERLKLKNKMDKEKRSKIPKDNYDNEDCISQFEEKMLNFLSEDVGLSYLPDEDEVDDEEINKIDDNNDSADLNDSENEFSDHLTDRSDCISENSEREIDFVMPEKTILIKQTKQIKDCKKALEKVQKGVAAKFQQKIISDRKHIQRISKSECLKLKKIKNLRRL